jgi:ribonuclease J
MAQSPHDERRRSESAALRIVAVGGLRQVGMNCLALEQAGERVLIDCGVAFAGAEWGVEAYRPRLASVIGGQAPLRGVVLSHGHEDHLGAVPDLLGSCNVPVWAGAYAIELMRRKLTEQFGSASSFHLHAVEPSQRFRVGPLLFEAIRVAHSTPDALAFAVHTAAGVLLHSGDFKLDDTLPLEERTDEERLRALGKTGVRLLLSDSTNSRAAGHSGTERLVSEALDGVIRAASGRVLVCLFASNVHRLRALGHLARRHGRRLCLLGRSMIKHVDVATALGRLDWPSDLLVSVAQADDGDPETVLYAATGTQGEARGALSRVAADSYPRVHLDAGDTVVLSSRVIPGHEVAVQATVDRLLRRGVRVHSAHTGGQLHTSGHAHREEQRRLLELVRPQGFMPVHGGREQLERHAELARECGVQESWVLDDGEVLVLGPDGADVQPATELATPVALAGGRAVPEAVLRERQKLGRAGVVCVSLWIPAAAAVRGSPPGALRVAVAALGVSADPQLLDRLEAVVSRALGPIERFDATKERLVREAVRRELRASVTGRPIVLVRIAGPGQQAGSDA